jgi:uncharacterized membrane protein SpoIIM required for sporulation
MYLIPRELDIGGVYFPPLLIASMLGIAVAWGMAHMLNRYRLSRFFAYPPLVLLALSVINTIVIGTFLIRG